MPELLSCLLFGTKLPKTKQEEESLGRLLKKHNFRDIYYNLPISHSFILCRCVWHAPGAKVVASHQGRVGTLSGTMTKDYVQIVQNSMTRVRRQFNLNNKSFGEFSASLTCLNVSFLGNYCPICFKCYEDNDYDSQMMQCGTCNHWVHAKCEDLTGDFYYWLCKHWWHTVLKLLNTGTALSNLNVICYCQLRMNVFLRLHLWILIMSGFLCLHPKYLSYKIISDELYEILSSLPESVVYSCRPCSVTQPSAWRELLYIELRAGVEKVLACLLSSTLTQHLVTCSQVGDCASIFISDALIDLPGTGIRWFSVFSTPTGDQPICAVMSWSISCMHNMHKYSCAHSQPYVNML